MLQQSHVEQFEAKVQEGKGMENYGKLLSKMTNAEICFFTDVCLKNTCSNTDNANFMISIKAAKMTLKQFS